ncbi:MAG: serine/threonine protein kinase [Gemmataceae bacterium]|nr:serine/threonine protein kinase [Gemmataceae bacterium]
MTTPRTGPTPPSRPGADPPITPADFLTAVVKSRLLTRSRLDAALAGLPAGRSARAVAEHLIAAGELTEYQADKLLAGRWQGLVVGPYRVLAPLGRGGMAAVYLARSQESGVRSQEAAGEPVALKVLPPQQAKEERALARFRREMDLGRDLAHPHVARALGAGEADGVHYIAMEYVPGRTLKQVVAQAGPLPVPAAARVFADAAAGLSHLHARGLIHRDLKPSNLMVRPDGRAMLLDLGLALRVDEDLPDDPAVVGGRGYILGTMDYIAPEQAVDATDVGPRADLYALGCSLYFALTGLPPFPGGDSKQKLRWHRTEDPPPVDHLNPSVPAAFARLVDRLMAKRPADRPNSAGVVRELLLPWAAEPAAEPEPPPADESPPDDAEPVAVADDGPPVVLPFGPLGAAAAGLLGVLVAFLLGVLAGLLGRL